MKMRMVRKLLAMAMAVCLLLTTVPAMAETAADTAAMEQKLDAAFTLAQNASKKEDWATARKYLNIAFAYCDRQSNPTAFAVLLLKQACLDVIEGDNDIALLALDAALTVDPDQADAYRVRAEIYTGAGNFTDAAANLEKYIELSQNTALYETVAQLHEANGDMAAAEAAYEKYATAVGEDDRDAGFQLGYYRMNNQKYEEAAEAFQAYAEDETYGAGALYNIGMCRMNLGDYAAAIEAFTAFEEKGVVFADLTPCYYRGYCYYMSGDPANAADDFARSVETESNADQARFFLGICKMDQGEYEAAVAAFDELVNAYEGQEELTLNDAVYKFRAVCNAQLGNLEQAVQDLTVCIDHGYELADTYYQRSQVYAAMGDAESQEKDMQEFMRYAK